MDRKPHLKLVHSISETVEPDLQPELAPQQGSNLVLPSDLEQLLGDPLNQFSKKRRQSRRKKKIEGALQHSHYLSLPTQKKLLEVLLAGGWGRIPHGLTRQLKCPKRDGLKRVEIALVITSFDRTMDAIKPCLFAPLAAEDFENETGIDRRDIGRALSALVLRGALLKMKIEGVIFWALNPHYFALREKRESPAAGNFPRGNSPSGNTPSDKSGEPPLWNDGGFSQGESGANVGNENENSVPQNHIQESMKESLFSGDEFPTDMLTRWSKLRASGQENKASKEREIFQKLFKRHGITFFEYCGRVVAFLLEHGSVKDGVKEEIHSPMVWIQDHWEQNLQRYKNWCEEQEALQKLHADRLEKEALLKAQMEEQRIAREKKAQEDALFREEQNAAAERFLSRYRDSDLINAFVREAIAFSANSLIASEYRKYGWDNPVVRFTVLEHFMKVETGERITQVKPSGRDGGGR